jgi:hypothetical protein
MKNWAYVGCISAMLIGVLGLILANRQACAGHEANISFDPTNGSISLTTPVSYVTTGGIAISSFQTDTATRMMPFDWTKAKVSKKTDISKIEFAADETGFNGKVHAVRVTTEIINGKLQAGPDGFTFIQE